MAHFFTDETWFARLAYLADIFNILNSLNLSLQGPDTHVLKTHDEVDAFRKKLSIWRGRYAEGIYDLFPLLADLQ